MGIDINGARFLLDCAKNGVVYDNCAMLGRQEMHLTPIQLEGVFRRLGVPFSGGEAEAIIENGGLKGYAENFLKKCGAKSVVSFDNSDYEGATVVLDMNKDIPLEYEKRFDCVIDSGTLEHVFNIPIALRNGMNMVKPGGHFLSIAPCNNFMGHGFYQFSPELFYGVLSERNGFEVERMFIFESCPDSQWYRVANPSKIGGRVELINSTMTYLLVQARRTVELALQDITPQQSDYQVMWDAKAPAALQTSVQSRLGSYMRIKGILKGKLRRILRLFSLEYSQTRFRRPWYEPYN